MVMESLGIGDAICNCIAVLDANCPCDVHMVAKYSDSKSI